MRIALLVLWVCCGLLSYGQTTTISGIVTDESTGKPIYNASIISATHPAFLRKTDTKGRFSMGNIPLGNHQFVVSAENYSTLTKDLRLLEGNQEELRFEMKPFVMDVPTATIEGNKQEGDIGYLKSVEGTAIYGGMKTEVIAIDNLIANVSTNNSRQVFAKVPGINIWENDGAGIQLGIGARGLSPNRTSHFNVRQNGYDISADALGYPESYYTPPLQAVKRIEIVRGAASLQYGTQFGGLLNFEMKKGDLEKPLEIHFSNTVGAFGVNDSLTNLPATYNAFLSLGGSKNRFRYYGFYQLKTGQGWRDWSDFTAHTAHFNVQYSHNENLTIGAELTFMDYLAQQPGGLIDVAFERNPRQTTRTRNWFAVDWLLANAQVDYVFNPQTALNSTFFGLVAQRKAIGFLQRPLEVDPGDTPRDLIWGNFRNWGNETRLIHKITRGEKIYVLLGGVRIYNGTNRSRQGEADATDRPNFSYLQTDTLDSDFTNPSGNVALFTQNIIPINSKLSLVPGARWEFINTATDGYFRTVFRDGGGNLIEDRRVDFTDEKPRNFLFYGLGMSYKLKPDVEIYANGSKNYRAINFSDLRVNAGALRIDENIKDERGFNLDLGTRGKIHNAFSWDASLFLLRYQDRIGTIQDIEINPSNGFPQRVRLRTNIGEATTYGFEVLGEVDLLNLKPKDKPTARLKFFGNVSLLNSTYTKSDLPGVEGNRVELAPRANLRSGINFSKNKIAVAVQWSYTSAQFSEASNTLKEPTGIDGVILPYYIADFTLKYSLKRMHFVGSINNLTDNKYYTRRATGYPGPGIIPADGRSFYFTVGITI